MALVRRDFLSLFANHAHQRVKYLDPLGWSMRRRSYLGKSSRRRSPMKTLIYQRVAEHVTVHYLLIRPRCVLKKPITLRNVHRGTQIDCFRCYFLQQQLAGEPGSIKLTPTYTERVYIMWKSGNRIISAELRKQRFILQIQLYFIHLCPYQLSACFVFQPWLFTN